MSQALTLIKGGKEAPKGSRSRMETLLVTAEEVANWRIPEFQRPLRMSARVMEVAAEIKRSGGFIPGIITLGRVLPDKALYIVDGQHRIAGFGASECKEGLADVRICDFDTVADMADEFVQLNSALVKMRPDDILRGMEKSCTSLQAIRKHCEFVGYDNLRRNPSSPVVSMSALLRMWQASSAEVPTTSGMGSHVLARQLDGAKANQIIGFLDLAHSAWGRDSAYYRLWGSLNLGLCMWLYRRMVLDRERGVKRFVVLTRDEFRKCLMALSADAHYLDWLQGRQLTDRDRSPGFIRIKNIMRARLKDERKMSSQPIFPQPAWAAK